MSKDTLLSAVRPPTDQCFPSYGDKGTLVIDTWLSRNLPAGAVQRAAEAVGLDWKPPDVLAYLCIPEIATRLLQEDLGLSREDAIVELIRSSWYGNVLFKDTYMHPPDPPPGSRPLPTIGTRPQTHRTPRGGWLASRPLTVISEPSPQASISGMEVFSKDLWEVPMDGVQTSPLPPTEVNSDVYPTSDWKRVLTFDEEMNRMLLILGQDDSLE